MRLTRERAKVTLRRNAGEPEPDEPVARAASDPSFPTPQFTTALHLRSFKRSPVAVGQRVYAADIPYNTLRTSQAQLAHHRQGAPESLPADTLFPTSIEQHIRGTYIAPGLRDQVGACSIAASLARRYRSIHPGCEFAAKIICWKSARRNGRNGAPAPVGLARHHTT